MAAGDWDAYWRNARSAAAHKDGGPQDEVLERYWLQFFKQITPLLQTRPRMLDIACGNGAVLRFALATFPNKDDNSGMQIYGLDASPEALAEMRKRSPGVFGTAANAASLPFQTGAFDLVTSQFGVEYAGPAALLEAARVVRRGGIIAAILHLRDGAIYQECAINLEAIEGIRNTNLLHSFEALFRAAYAVQQGQGSKELFHSADQEFARSVAAVEDILRRLGKGIADGMLLRLYTDIAHMYRRFKNYEPEEVFSWISLMGHELDTYAGRMASMLKAALDAQQLENLTDQLASSEFIIRTSETMTMGRLSRPAAWVVVAQKSN